MTAMPSNSVPMKASPALQEQKEKELIVQEKTEPGGELAWMGAMEYRQLLGVQESPPPAPD